MLVAERTDVHICALDQNENDNDLTSKYLLSVKVIQLCKQKGPRLPNHGTNFFNMFENLWELVFVYNFSGYLAFCIL